MCVCDSMSVVLGLKHSKRVLARRERLLIQLVAAKALSPLSSSLCLSLSQNPFLSQSRSLSPPLHFTHTYYKQDILLNPKSLPLLLCFFVRSLF